MIGDVRSTGRWRAGAAGLAMLGLAGCADDPGAAQALGSGLGAAAGALLGNKVGSGAGRTIATSAGAALGAYLGGQWLRQLSESARAQANAAQYEALERSPSGQPVVWRDPDSGSRGQVIAQPAYRANENEPCRRFSHVVDLNGSGEVTEAKGVACREPDGSWTLVQEE
jgi:surface antigen